MTLTVGFDATAAARQRAGIGRYTRELLAALSHEQADVRFKVFYCGGGHPQGELPRMDNRFAVRRIPLSDRLVNAVWQRAQIPLPVQAVIGGFDVFHSPDFTLPPVPFRPTVLTIHDLAFLTRPECAYPTLRSYLARVVPRSVRRATRVIAVSEHTRRDLAERLGVDEGRIAVVPEATGPQFVPACESMGSVAALTRLGLSRPYVLAVGTLEPRKNYVRLLEAFALARSRGLRHHLVIAGARGWLYEPIFERLDALSLAEHVTILRPDEPTLVSLYQAADVCVFPSLYEGFGMPALEALACGVPLACSSSSSLPEVVGQAALLFDPEDVASMAECIERLTSDSVIAAELRRRGPRQAARFSWQRTAMETLRVYREVAEGG